MGKVFLGLLFFIALVIYLIGAGEDWWKDRAKRKAKQRIDEIQGEHEVMDANEKVEEAENELRYRKQAKA